MYHITKQIEVIVISILSPWDKVAEHCREEEWSGIRYRVRDLDVDHGPRHTKSPEPSPPVARCNRHMAQSNSGRGLALI